MLEHITPSISESSDHWWQQKQPTLEISVDPLTHQIRLIHPHWQVILEQSSPGDSSSSGNSFQNFIHDRLTILILILCIFIAEIIFLGWFYGPLLLGYFRGEKRTKGSSFTRKPQRRAERRQTPFPDLEVATDVG